MLKSADIPYWRLSSFYFFYFSFLGVWVPFWNLYLEQELLFSAAQIGYVTSLVLGTKIVGPYLWGWLADHYGQRMKIIRLGAFVAFLSFTGVFFWKDFWGILFVVAFYSFFWNAVLSQFEVVTLSHLKEKSSRYTLIRLWGSVGFVLAVFILGFFFEHFSLSYLPIILLVLLGGIWASSLIVREGDTDKKELESWQFKHESGEKSEKRLSSFSQFIVLVRKPHIVVFFFACFIIQFSHGPYYTFYSIYLEQLGYQRSLIGALWSLGVIAEIILFVFMHKLFQRFSLRVLLVFTLILTALRWFVIAAFAEYLYILVLAQLLHAASFGSFHAIAIEMVRRYFTADSVGQGQAFYSAISFGAGGSLGALLSGTLWVYGVSNLFIMAGVSVLVGLLVVLVMGKHLDGA